MPPPFCSSSSRNTVSPEAFLFHKHRSSSSALLLKPNLSLPRSSYSLLSLKNSRLTHSFASISSFAEAEGEEEQNEGLQVQEHHHDEPAKTEAGDDDLPGMAQAFHISSSTASAISICIALAALTLPFFMKSLGQGLDIKTKLLSHATLLFGFYMAWNIGANDVANAMGTSVGSGALTLRQAVLTAAVLEFSGALLMGTHVTSTMQKGILVASVFQGKDTLLFAGLLSSLAAAGTWLQVHYLSFLL